MLAMESTESDELDDVELMVEFWVIEGFVPGVKATVADWAGAGFGDKLTLFQLDCCFATCFLTPGLFTGMS